ncbi:MAG: response regulator, partial [Melioribacteraceae bacterium]
EAIETFAKYKPDWIVMDLKMEIMDGLTASKEILKLNQDARIIILTQFDDEEYFDVAKEIGVKAFIQKENILDIPHIIENLNF